MASADLCECISPGTACAAVKRADAVFVGRVTGLADGVQFDVERTITGVPLGRITVGNGPGDCGIKFTVGDRYIVYAHRDRSGALFTGGCTRTSRLGDPYTSVDLKYFDRRERNAPGGLLTGVVQEVTEDLSSPAARSRPLAKVRVTVSAETGPARTTVTGADGSYELTGLPPGRLQIAASLPRRFESPQPVTALMADGCAEANIIALLDGRIRGQLLDEGGRPARGIGVQLADGAAARADARPLRTMSVLTDEQGAFEFRYVNAGRYVVGVGLDRSIQPGKLNRRRFHVNALDVNTATVVTLGVAQRLQLPPFRLAPLPSDRVITVVVHAPTADVATATALFLTGSQREPLFYRSAPLSLTLPFGARFMIEAMAPKGYKIILPATVRIDRDETDRTIEFRVEK